MSAGNDHGPWFPVALSRDIGTGTAAPTRLNGREIALWRSESGEIHAWEDRCPHRGMRLSFGFVRGEQIACLYHGWHYGSDGGCEVIPAHPGLVPPKTICATVFPCEERDGLVWMSPERTMPVTVNPPSLPDGTLPVRSLTIDTAADAIVRYLSMDTGTTRLRASLLTLPVAGGDRSDEIRFLAIQPMDADRTTLHILAKFGDTENGPARLTKIAAWSEHLRRSLESSDTAAADAA